MTRYSLTHLDLLEAESIHIMREVAAEFSDPVMLYSVGKDSSVMVRLAQKAFYPGPIPFPLLHIDTSYKFQEMYDFRDAMAKEVGFRLIVHRNEEAIAKGANPWELGTSRCCGYLKTEALLQGLRKGGYDAAFGGARRDEEKSRAKERIYSFRDKHGQWNPKGQRPELWNIYNGRCHDGESFRVFPLSNWTEIDVWRYIEREAIPIVPMYFARTRDVVVRGGQLIPVEGHAQRILPGEVIEQVTCRFRSLGCIPCTGAVRSEASTLREILEELEDATQSERATRVIDHDSEGSMERKKQEGYF